MLIMQQEKNQKNEQKSNRSLNVYTCPVHANSMRAICRQG